MSLSLNEIKKKIISNKQELDSSTEFENDHNKENLLRPWQSFEQEKDLVELIANRKKKKNKVQRESLLSKKQPDEKTPEELLNSKIKFRATKLFKNLN